MFRLLCFISAVILFGSVNWVQAQASDPFADLRTFEQALISAVEAEALDDLWQAIVARGEMPLIFGETAVFMHRAEAETVDWRGDYSQNLYDPAFEGQRIIGTDLWLMVKRLPPTARLEYRIVIDRQSAILDPLNLRTANNSLGTNSLLIMPEYVASDLTQPQPSVARGTLSAPQQITSTALGTSVTIQVYVPAQASTTPLPVLYVLDGHEYADEALGGLPIALDNLIARGAIEPVLAVFIDPREAQTGTSRRRAWYRSNPAFAQFIAQELVPFIDERYATLASPSERVVLGYALGAVGAASVVLSQPDTFDRLAMQSPFFTAQREVLNAFLDAEPLPGRIFFSQGAYDIDPRNSDRLLVILRRRNAEHRFHTAPAGHSWGAWIDQYEGMLRYFFGTRTG